MKKLVLITFLLLANIILLANGSIYSHIDLANQYYVTGWSVNLNTQSLPSYIGLTIYPEVGRYDFVILPDGSWTETLRLVWSDVPLNIGYTVNYGSRADVASYFGINNNRLGYGINYSSMLTAGHYLVKVWSLDAPIEDDQYYDLRVQ